MSIDSLIIKAGEGSRDALKSLYEKTAALVFSAALSVLRSRPDAEDVVQETFITVMTEAKSFRHGGKAWLYRIAHNKAINLYRKKQREVAQDFSEDEKKWGSYGFENEWQNGEVISCALKILSEQERQIVLAKNSGLKHREIASALSLPPGTVTSLYNRALKKLKTEIEQGGGHL